MTPEQALAQSVGGADAVEAVKDDPDFADPDAVDEDDLPATQTVIVEDRPPSLLNQVFSTAPDLLGGVALAFVFLYFLLAEGDAILNNVLGLLPTVHEKREAVELTRAAEKGVSRYLFAVAVINAGLGRLHRGGDVAGGAAEPRAVGGHGDAAELHPVRRGVPRGGDRVPRGVPGAVLRAVAGGPGPAVLHGDQPRSEGNFVTPAILGKTIALNPLMVLLSLAFWGWIWGPGGGRAGGPAAEHGENPLRPVRAAAPDRPGARAVAPSPRRGHASSGTIRPWPGRHGLSTCRQARASGITSTVRTSSGTRTSSGRPP